MYNMEQFFTTIPGIVISLGAILVVVVTGLLYLLGLWKKGKNQEDDRLIGLLQETVTALEDKVNFQKQEHDENMKELTEKIGTLITKVDFLELENKTLRDVLQGRDEQTQLFYKKAFEAIEIGHKTYEVVENMSKNHAELMKMLIEHLKPAGMIINNNK